ncbi:hypothetical protein K438DRAFT_2027382 [Mycena galopus ATCC 62051]|nr:hypothetical protein K438DRAFT_2027382 [Mycena galopus ATCC 62051]
MTRAEATQKAPYKRLLFLHLQTLHNLDSDSACGCYILPRHIHRRPSEYNATRAVRLYIPSLLALPASLPSAVLSYVPTRIPLSSVHRKTASSSFAASHRPLHRLVALRSSYEHYSYGIPLRTHAALSGPRESVVGIDRRQVQIHEVGCQDVLRGTRM